MTPILIIWRTNSEFKKWKSKLLKYLISIWIGLFISFIIPHKIFTSISNKYWQTAAIETEKILNNYEVQYGKYPNNIDDIPESSISDKSFIIKRYIQLIHLKLSDNIHKEFSAYDSIGYSLTTGFWYADIRTWDSKEKNWIYTY